MKQIINCYFGALLATASFDATGTDAHSIQSELETFFSSGVGTIVFVILLLLALLWLLLPLAVFGLKSKLKYLIKENTETNRLLSDIRNELAAYRAEDTTETETALAEDIHDEDAINQLIEENHDLTLENTETNRILADIREILAALSEEEATELNTEQPERTADEKITAELYDEVKFDP